ncbi:hypothetical protein [Dickeya zeae]|nr:hypothetical protein [Dickeya zeae]
MMLFSSEYAGWGEKRYDYFSLIVFLFSLIALLFCRHASGENRGDREK